MSERFADRMRRQRMEAIVHAAAELIAEHGASQLRVEEVARRSGVAKGTIYLDFGSKDELIETALTTCRDEILALLVERVEDFDHPYARLTKAVACLADLPTERPHLGAVLGGLTIERRDRWPCPKLEAFIGDLIVRAQENGDVRPGIDPPLVAQIALAATYLPAWRKLIAEHGSEEAAGRLLVTIGVDAPGLRA